MPSVIWFSFGTALYGSPVSCSVVLGLICKFSGLTTTKYIVVNYTANTDTTYFLASAYLALL